MKPLLITQPVSKGRNYKMPGKSEKKTAEISKAKEIFFKCKFCGKTKPLSALVVLNQYYPQLSACKACAVEPKNPPPDDNKSDTESG
jgi:hypothetical protein